MDRLLQDLRAAARILRKSPGFTLVVVAALTLGIGANSAIFSAINAVVLRPLSYGDPERILVLSERREDGIFSETIRLANLEDYKERNRSLAAIAAFLPTGFNLAAGGDPERVKGARVSAGFFDVLGRAAAVGRGFTPDDDQAGAAPVVVLSHGLWQRRFGSDRSLIGKTIALDSSPHTVVGVMPPGFGFSLWDDQDLWVPRVFSPQELADRDTFLWYVIARLRPDYTLERAQTDLGRIAVQLAQEHPRRTGSGGSG